MAKSIILKDLLKKLRYSVLEFEMKIGVPRGRINASISRNTEISKDTVDKITTAFPHIRKEWLQTGEGEMFVLQELEHKYATGAQLRLDKALGKSSDDEQGLIYVPIGAQAGYTRNFTDPIFINQLDRLYIPGLPYRGDRYRYFDVIGDSMEPTILEGMQVIGEYVDPEYWKDIADYYVHVIVLDNKIIIKRTFKKNPDILVLISDNDAFYPQVTIPFSDIKEIWFVKRILDWRIPPPKKIEITA